ncbi:Peroxidase 15 [Capsicum annuum]|uniref:peroxidase n=1 Tax=Capsicum annuum TaxID=4072 RepID=A0A2G2YS57_CAPAN|nr:Peroxidase 15 [Capsicum annuum]KAF3641290.1 Peroxidase 15 [Capsicum annuum]PHT72461.1 Peroxidase 15 [Capsicum annuum]
MFSSFSSFFFVCSLSTTEVVEGILGAFVSQGCDASLHLDNSRGIVSEKGSNANRNSSRGFDVIDDIKSALEKECPQTVSCADILALAARDSTVSTGGPNWEVPLGRKDSRSASLSVSNNNIPAPNNTFAAILSRFKRQGLDLVDLVALSGSHTIGNSSCTSFRQRLYNQSRNNNQTRDNLWLQNTSLA